MDHSSEMIDLSGKLNKGAIKQERLKLLVGSVSEIKIDDSSLDLVTAFETVQFWPDIELAFTEIFRVLDKKGEFIIMNRFPKEGTKWWDLAKLKSREEYQEKLENAGFSDVSIDLGYKKGWVIAKGIK